MPPNIIMMFTGYFEENGGRVHMEHETLLFFFFNFYVSFLSLP